MDRDVWYINNTFSKQAYYDKIFKLHQTLFNLSLKMDFQDWMNIYVDEYWEVYDSFEDKKSRLEFTIQIIKAYLGEH